MRRTTPSSKRYPALENLCSCNRVVVDATLIKHLWGVEVSVVTPQEKQQLFKQVPYGTIYATSNRRNTRIVSHGAQGLSTIVLGARGGIWTPHWNLRFGDHFCVGAKGGPDAVVVVSDSVTVGKYVIHGLRAKGVLPLAVLSTESRNSQLRQNLISEACRDYPSCFLVVVIESPANHDLLTMTDILPVNRTILALTEQNQTTSSDRDHSAIIYPSFNNIAMACGWTLTYSLEQAISLCDLYRRGCLDQIASWSTNVRTDAERKLLRKRLVSIEMDTHASFSPFPSKLGDQGRLDAVIDHSMSSKGKKKPDTRSARLLFKEHGHLDSLSLAFTNSSGKQETLPADSDRLGAVGAQIATYRQKHLSYHGSRYQRQTIRLPCPVSQPFINELILKTQLKRSGFKTPQAVLVRSETAAAQAFRTLKSRVVAKAITRSFVDRAAIGAIASHLGDAAAVKRAFRSILIACERLARDSPIEGVLISESSDFDTLLTVQTVWLSGRPIVQVQLSLCTLAPIVVCIAALPLSKHGAGEFALRIVQALENMFTPSSVPPVDMKTLERTLLKLSQFSTKLADELSWLQVVLSLPTPHKSAMSVVDACAQRRHNR